MNLTSPNPLRRVLALASALAITMAVALPAVAQDPQDTVSDAQYLIYLPSRSPSVDHGAIIQSLGDIDFDVITLAYAGEPKLDYARRVASEVRALMARGIAPAAITVLGAGTGSPVAVLTSAATGNRHVNYVLLGECDSLLKVDYRFRMSGRVLGLRDAADSGSGSCRPLWSGSPKVSERRDIVLDTGHGAALFDQPRPQWLQPIVEWAGGGTVDVGRIRIGAVERPAPAAGDAATGAGD